MTEKHSATWGPFGIISALIGILSWFFGGVYSLILGITAVCLGFIGTQKHQKLCLTGMLLGSFSLIFINLLDLGIIPKFSIVNSDKSHLVNSIKSSIHSFESLKNGTHNDEEKNKLIWHLRNALKEARLVNVDNVESQVHGFTIHYREDFINGIELLIEGYSNTDLTEKIKGAFLLDRWAKWYKENLISLEKIRDPSLSILSLLRGLTARRNL